MIITRTPLRISLIGGGTDVPAFYERHLGAVISFAINKYVYVSVNRRFEEGFRVSYSTTEEVLTRDQIQHDLVRIALGMTKLKGGLEITSIADIPGRGSGLGSSSAFTVGLLKALLKETDDENPIATLAERAHVVESERSGGIGKQDQYAASYGGINYMTFGKRNVCVKPLHISQEWKDDFEKHSLLLWTGISRNANPILVSQKKNITEGRSVETMMEMSKLAQSMYEKLIAGTHLRSIAEIIEEGWQYKRRIAPEISNPEIDAMHDTIMRCGAWGTKLCGAGGGGFMFVLAPVHVHRDILGETKLRKVNFKMEMEGSKVIYDSVSANA